MKKNYCVIMAGGVGSRFWPLSTTSCPKQFLDPLGLGKSFLRLTYERFLGIVPSENFFVVTSEDYKAQVMEHLPELSENQILLEPLRRNTAPCIAYATWKIGKKDPDASIVVTPSDHLIVQETEFRKIVSEGLDFVSESDDLLTIGIHPTKPEIGYGYIQFDKNSTKDGFNKVITFTEKPDRELAEVFVKSGEFLWNSGIFIWSVDAIKKAMREFLPDLVTGFDEGEKYLSTKEETDFIEHVYSIIKPISIDYGVMEKSKNVFVRAGNFGWSDIGTWGSLHAQMSCDENGNALRGNVLCYDSKNSLVIVDKDKTAIVQGLDDMLIVSEKDRLLVCKIKNEQSLRLWTDDLKRKQVDK